MQQRRNDVRYCTYCGTEFPLAVAQQDSFAAYVHKTRRCAACNKRAVKRPPLPPPPEAETRPSSIANAMATIKEKKRNNAQPKNGKLIDLDGGNDEDEEDNEQSTDDIARDQEEDPDDSTDEETDAIEMRDLRLPADHYDIIYCYLERFRGPYITSLHLRRESNNEFLMCATFKTRGGGPAVIHKDESVRDAGEFEIAVPGNDDDPRFLAYLMDNSVTASDFTCELRHRESDKGRMVFGAGSWGVSESVKASKEGEEEDEDDDDDNGRPFSRNTVMKGHDNHHQRKGGFHRNFTNDPAEFPHLDVCLIRYFASLIGSHPSAVSVTVRCDPCAGGGGRGHYEEDEHYDVCCFCVAFRDVPRLTLLHQVVSRATPSIRERLQQTSTVRFGEDATLLERLGGGLTGNMDAGGGKAYVKLGGDESEGEIATFETRRPVWDKAMNGWSLDFNGRAVIASKKNVILVPGRREEHRFGCDTVILRMGKVEKHKFNLDFRNPVSPLCAMALATSLFFNNPHVPS